MSHSEETVKTSDHIEIYVQSWEAESAKAQLVIVHGYLEHGGRYREFCEYLASKGISTTVFDKRGHGKSSGRRGYCWNFSDYHVDLDSVLENFKGKTELPKFVLGHSAGGAVVIDYLMAKERLEGVDGILMTSPFLGPAEEISTVKKIAARILGWIIPFMAIPAGEVTAEVLTHDEQKRKEHDQDALNLHSATIGWGYAIQVFHDKLQKWKKEFDVPVWFAFAELDKVADPNQNREFAQVFTSPDKTVVERKGEFHELLNEVNRKETYELIRKWILEHATEK